MRICTVTIEGLSPYSASRSHQAEKLAKETAHDYENRTWRNKAHVYDGQVIIPPMAFKIGLDRAAKMLGRQIPGKGKSTYTKYFESGVLVVDNIPIAAESAILCEDVFANADGVRGSGKRVWRKFPKITDWRCTVPFHIFADELTREVFEEAVAYAGQAVGVGRFRPERGGFFGRFRATGFSWS